MRILPVNCFELSRSMLTNHVKKKFRHVCWNVRAVSRFGGARARARAFPDGLRGEKPATHNGRGESWISKQTRCLAEKWSDQTLRDENERRREDINALRQRLWREMNQKFLRVTFRLTSKRSSSLRKAPVPEHFSVSPQFPCMPPVRRAATHRRPRCTLFRSPRPEPAEETNWL